MIVRRPEPRQDGSAYVVIACAALLVVMFTVAWAIGKLAGA